MTDDNDKDPTQHNDTDENDPFVQALQDAARGIGLPQKLLPEQTSTSVLTQTWKDFELVEECHGNKDCKLLIQKLFFTPVGAPRVLILCSCHRW